MSSSYQQRKGPPVEEPATSTGMRRRKNNPSDNAVSSSRVRTAYGINTQILAEDVNNLDGKNDSKFAYTPAENTPDSVSNAGESDERPIMTETDFPIFSNSWMGDFSLDNDVKHIDLFLYRMCRYVVLMWLLLIALVYWAAPDDSIVVLEGAERNAALVEVVILITSLIMRHGPLLWDIKRETGSFPPRISGVLAGGLTTQLVATFTMIWMVSFPVPVMVDPVFKSRVHLLRWCEWAPLAGFMTLLMQCIDAPTEDDGVWSSNLKQKLLTASLQSLSTLCGILFPFCPNLISWSICMIISCITFLYIFYSYAQKERQFRSITRGKSEDHIEMYERSRLSMSLHGICCFTWTLITVGFFVSSSSHLYVPTSYTWLHNPAITMIEECGLDCLAKVLYMALIIEADSVAFDEVKRANRRLAELKNTINAVWENSSDTIAISIQKISGNITSMISPSFFKEALAVQGKNANDISAVVLDIQNQTIQTKRDHFTNVAASIASSKLPCVRMKIISKKDFDSLNLHHPRSDFMFDPIVGHQGKEETDLMTYYVVAFSDIMSRAWQTKASESVFEHDLDPINRGGSATKFEVKVTRLDGQALVVVVRNVSERYKRFEAEKRFVIETTARQKDADANRFTKHEVKNGLLSAIEICSNLREKIAADSKLQKVLADGASSDENLSAQVAELDTTLHDVLDIVLAEAMARDVIHEMYEPKMNRVDINRLLSFMKGLTGSNHKFELISSPSPLPFLLSDHGLLKCIYNNAIRNAMKYGRPGGKITTEASYAFENGMIEIKIINLPGPGHKELVDMGSRACDLVFSHGTRLHKDTTSATRSLSAGDGAWIIRKCAKMLDGVVGISFEPERTVFTFKAPVELYDASSEAGAFMIPVGVWGIAIDDSKIQRKLLSRFLVHTGIHEQHQIILGQNSQEILDFVNFTTNFVKKHPDDRFLIIVDENLELGGESSMRHETLSGSKCIQQIRNILDPVDESRVLACVRSANDSQNDQALYLSRAHGSISKMPLRAIRVKETVYALWKERFGSDGQDDRTRNESGIQRISSLEDMTLISSAELLQELEEIDAICIRDQAELDMDDRWFGVWEKLHQLKGDLKSANIDGKYAEAVKAIDSMRGENAPTDFLEKWLNIRQAVIDVGT